MDDRRSLKSLPIPNASVTSSATAVSLHLEPADAAEANTSTFSCSLPSEEEIIESNAFGESGCGEPLVPHHLLLDFTPSEDDTDFVRKKCSDFWEYIKSRDDLQYMMVVPEDTSNIRGDTIKDTVPDSDPASTVCLKKPTTAVSMLQLVEGKGLIDRAFEAKMLKSHCSMGKQEYELDLKVEQSICRCPEPCSMCSNALSSEAHTLCEELDAWDLQHPKSMEPPGQPPACDENTMIPK